MNSYPRITAAILVASLFAVPAALAQTSAVPSDAEIRKILVDRIDVQKQSVGIVVGVIEPSGRRVVSYGKLAKDDSRPLNGDTLYEIGSITKVFTSLLLTDAVERGEVALTDPVAKFLPATVKMPERGGRVITLQDLATHTSGLAPMPSNVRAGAADPFADYSAEDMYAFLSGYQLTRDIASQYQYSNFGAGVLGQALTLRTHAASYEALVQARVTKPLGLTSTAITLSPEMKARLATGYLQTLSPAPSLILSVLAPAGALRSTANDMLTFLAANLGYVKTPLAGAMADMLKVRRPTGAPNLEVALAWHVLTSHGKEIVWHNGGTNGYRTFIGYDQKARQLLEKYVGRYQLVPAVSLTVTRDGSHLFVQLTGQPKFEVFGETDKAFFLKVVDAQITFEVDAAGKAVAVVLHQNGRDQRAPRAEGEAPAPPKSVVLDAAVLDGCVGQYQLAPGADITISRSGTQLFAQITGQPKVEILAKSATEFFYTVVDAQITFERDAQGRATSLVLHQGGRDLPAPRIE